MRVVEPHHFSKIKKKKQKKNVSASFVLLPVLIVAGIVGYVLYGQQYIHKPKPHETSTAAENKNQQAQNKPAKQLTLKEFTDDEFKELYTSFAYPNTQQLTDYPTITGNSEADERIVAIAKERGYVLSAVPVASIIKIDEPYLTDDDLLQPNAKIGWDTLKEAADKADIPLQITSAYRSIELQRSVFLQYLRDAGVTAPGIADGFSDGSVQQVMDRVAPPGFSRHHTGYTIDLACDGIGLYGFKNTSCYEWLSADNFKIAKTHGWVPSYPEEASQQGPSPEPWEFIWVGSINLYE